MNDSGYVTIEWVYGDEEEQWEPVATLKYWEVAAIRDALRLLRWIVRLLLTIGSRGILIIMEQR